MGLGKIGMEYDYNFSSEKFVLSHAQALSLHPKFDLIGGVDNDLKKLKKFKRKFKLPTYKNLKEAFKYKKPDLVIISVPTKNHYDIFLNIVKLKFNKIILFEKPIGENYVEAKKIIRKSRNSNIKIAVNYIRQYQHDIIGIIKKLKKNELKEINVRYNRGLINNCSHFINLLSSIFGKVKSIKLLSEKKIKEAKLYNANFILYFKKIKANFFFVKNKKNNIGEISFISKNQKLTFRSGFNKVIIENIKTKSKKIIFTNMYKYQFHVYDSIYKSVSKNKNLLCNGNSALRTFKILNKIEKKFDEK